MDRDKVSALRRRVIRILAQSNDWHAWQTALETVLGSEEDVAERHRSLYCVDTSEIVEYLAPGSLVEEKESGGVIRDRGEEYPTPLDLSLLILFKPGQPILMLPPHILELRSLTGVWMERARLVRQKFSLLQEALQTYDARLQDLQAEGAEGDEGIEQFVQFVLREGRSFGLIFWLSAEGERGFGTLMKRLEVPDRAALQLPGDWTYQPDRQEIEAWYQQLEETGLGSGGQASHRRDAHALHFLAQVNAELPADSFLILSTHSGNIWKVVEDKRKAAGNDKSALWKGGEAEGEGGRSLIQRPQVALIRKLLDEAQEGQERDELLQQIAIERMRNQSLSELRARLEHEILPRLSPKSSPRPDLDQVERLVKDLEDGLRSLESISLDRQRLERTRLALESVVGEQGPLARLREVIKGRRGEELKVILQKELGDVLKELDRVQQKLSLAASVIPSSSLSFEGFEDHESSAGVRGILRSRPGGMAHTIHFQSPAVELHLKKLEALLRTLDSARQGAKGASRVDGTVRRDLQREMYECRIGLQNEPEYYLLLAFVYSSRQMWFQVFGAADQGLRMIQEREDPEPVERPSLGIASAWTELLLVKAMAFTNWTLESYTDLPHVATGFLGQAAGLVRDSLRQQQRWSAVLPYYKGRDPRCLRELGILYGAAREAGLDLDVNPEDCALAGLPAEPRPDLLELFLAFSRAAYLEVQREKTEHEEVRTAYEDSLLYALTERDREDDLAERSALADVLRHRPETWKEAKFLDTLAWHHFRLAKRCRGSGQPFSGDLQVAAWYIGEAGKVLNEDNGYYTRLLREHRRQIEALR